jgi:ketosteroid isomerase-like protein
MATKTDVLRERYALFSQGDLEGALDLWTDDFVWEGADESGLPGSGRHEGKQASIEVLKETVGAWDTFELSADEFIEQGDTVAFWGTST